MGLFVPDSRYKTVAGVLVIVEVFRARQKLGKYVIESRIDQGGFAVVYKAYDTIEGIHVALKVPHRRVLLKEELEQFRREVRLAARLDHPHILPLKNAGYIKGHFVMVTPLGRETLADRLHRRLPLPVALDFAHQMLEAVAYAHSNRIIHCDIKPENLIFFGDNHLRLTDFGIAKFVRYTMLQASGSGTIGYVAPEQAMGRPSYRSDVFSLGLVLYQMVSGTLPSWPYSWPPAGFDRIRRRLHPDLIDLLRRSLEVDPGKRFENAVRMLSAFERIKRPAIRFQRARSAVRRQEPSRPDWKTVRRKQFLKQFGRILATHSTCSRCEGPVSESMHACPWCGRKRAKHSGETRLPAKCPRCGRGMKLDWRYCPWCFGPGFEPSSSRQFSDVRYSAKCSNQACSRRDLMPFMRYCPWCRRKVQRKWKIPHATDKCSSCGWGVLPAFWNFCPWCGKRIAH